MSDEEGKKPKKSSKKLPKRRARKKAAPKKISPEKTDLDVLSHVLGLSAEDKKSSVAALSAFFAVAEDPRVTRHREIMDLLCGNVQEYLSNFILIGYTVNGDPVNITYGKSARDYDSLNTALHKYIMDNYSPPPPPPTGKY